MGWALGLLAWLEMTVECHRIYYKHTGNKPEASIKDPF